MESSERASSTNPFDIFGMLDEEPGHENGTVMSPSTEVIHSDNLPNTSQFVDLTNSATTFASHMKTTAISNNNVEERNGNLKQDHGITTVNVANSETALELESLTSSTISPIQGNGGVTQFAVQPPAAVQPQVPQSPLVPNQQATIQGATSSVNQRVTIQHATGSNQQATIQGATSSVNQQASIQQATGSNQQQVTIQRDKVSNQQASIQQATGSNQQVTIQQEKDSNQQASIQQATGSNQQTTIQQETASNQQTTVQQETALNQQATIQQTTASNQQATTQKTTAATQQAETLNPLPNKLPSNIDEQSSTRPKLSSGIPQQLANFDAQKVLQMAEVGATKISNYVMPLISDLSATIATQVERIQTHNVSLFDASPRVVSPASANRGSMPKPFTKPSTAHARTSSSSSNPFDDLDFLGQHLEEAFPPTNQIEKGSTAEVATPGPKPAVPSLYAESANGTEAEWTNQGSEESVKPLSSQVEESKANTVTECTKTLVTAESVEDMYSCPVCLDLFCTVAPRHVVKCAHCAQLFCKQCLVDSLVSTKGTCPLCRENPKPIKRHHEAERVVGCIPGMCNFAILGCTMELPRRELDRHEAKCAFRKGNAKLAKSISKRRLSEPRKLSSFFTGSPFGNMGQETANYRRSEHSGSLLHSIQSRSRSSSTASQHEQQTLATEWACLTCTFVNHPAMVVCEICESPKSNGSESTEATSVSSNQMSNLTSAASHPNFHDPITATRIPTVSSTTSSSTFAASMNRSISCPNCKLRTSVPPNQETDGAAIRCMFCAYMFVVVGPRTREAMRRGSSRKSTHSKMNILRRGSSSSGRNVSHQQELSRRATEPIPRMVNAPATDSIELSTELIVKASSKVMFTKWKPMRVTITNTRLFFFHWQDERREFLRMSIVLHQFLSVARGDRESIRVVRKQMPSVGSPRSPQGSSNLTSRIHKLLEFASIATSGQRSGSVKAKTILEFTMIDQDGLEAFQMLLTDKISECQRNWEATQR